MKKLLLIKLASLGDILHATPLIEVLSRKYELYFLTFNQNFHLVKNNPHIKEVLLLNDSWRLRNVLKNLYIFIHILSLKIDISLNLHKIYKLNIMCKFMGIRERLGLVKKNEKKNAFLTGDVEFNQTEHHIVQYCKFAKELGLNCNDYNMRYYPGFKELDISKFNLIKGNYVVCCPGGGKNKWAEMSSKRWPVEKYVKFFNKVLVEKKAKKIVLIGDTGDIGINEQIVAMVKNDDIVDLTNKLFFDDLFYLISDSFCYIGNDSFLLHFASTTGIKTIGIFGPTSGDLLAPLGVNNYYIQSSSQCSPCYDANEAKKSLAYSCEDKKCIVNITVDDIYDLFKDKI